MKLKQNKICEQQEMFFSNDQGWAQGGWWEGPPS